MRNHIGLIISRNKKPTYKGKDHHSFSVAHIGGYNGKVIPMIVLGKIPKNANNMVESNIFKTLEHEVIHIILWKEIGEECSRAFDNICEHLEIKKERTIDNEELLERIREYLKEKERTEEKFKCEACNEQCGISTRTILDDGNKYVVCCSCIVSLINNSLSPDQFNNLLKNGHSRKEFLLHLDFYDYDGVALQPLVCERNTNNFLNGRWEKRAYDVD